MKVEIETPSEFQGSVIGDLSSRRGVIYGTEMKGDETVINSGVPLGEMFGYESFNWSSLFTWNFEISQPEIVGGEETVCAIAADDVFSVLGIYPGSCSVKYPSRNGGIEGFIFLTVKVVDG
mgnify:CR=1 FL=1